MSASAVPPTAMRDRWLLSREKRLESAEGDKPRPATSRRQHRLSRIQFSQLLPTSHTAPTIAAMPTLSLRPTTTATSRRVPVHSLRDIPTVDHLDVPSKERYSVRWGQQSSFNTEEDDAVPQYQPQPQQSYKQDERDSYDKESFSLPSVRVRPPLPSLSAHQSREAAVLHSVHLPQKPKQFISKRARKLAFSHDFSSSLSSSLTASSPPSTQPQRVARPHRAATANSGASSSSSSILRSRMPHLSFALYHHVVQPAESISEEQNELSSQPTPPLLATPIFSPFASPALTPHLTPSHSSLSSPSRSPSFSPLSSSTLRYYDEDVWSDLLAFHTSSSTAQRHERLLYVLGQCGEAISATVRETLHSGLIERYVRERPGYVSRLVWVEQVWQELKRTVVADAQAANVKVNAIASWLSADMALHVLDGTAELNASGLSGDSVSAASLFHTLLSILASHVYSHHPHFPATPYHLQQQQLARTYTTLQQQHATELQTAKQKAQQHTVECQRWQAAIRNTRHRYTRAILALTFLRWRHVTIRAKWRRGTTTHDRYNDEKAEEEGKEGEWMQRVCRLQQRWERKFQARSLFVTWRAYTLSSCLQQLQSTHSHLLSSYPLSQSRILSLESHHSSLQSSYATSVEQLHDRKQHLVMLEAQEVAYGMELRQEEAGVSGVKELLSMFDVLCDVVREEVELGAVQLLTSGWQDGKRLTTAGRAGDEEELNAEESEWKQALDDGVASQPATELRWKDRSTDATDGNELVPSKMVADTAKADYTDRLLYGWLTQQAALASGSTEPSSGSSVSPQERYVMQARERLLSFLRSQSSNYSSTYARRYLLQQHFARGERMEEALRATHDGVMTHRPTTSGGSEGEMTVVGLDELLKRQEDEERLDDEVVMSVPSDDAMSRSGGGRTRVPSSPHVSVMAHTMRRSNSSLHRPMQQSFSATMPLTATVVEEQPATAKKEVAEASGKPEEAAAGTAAETKEREVDVQERRKKKPVLTIQISTQRSMTALPTIPSPPATSQPALPSSPPQAVKTAVSAEPASGAAPSSAAPGSARTRFHRSSLRSRGSRATSMFSSSGGSMLPSSASPLPPPLSQATDATELSPRNDYATQMQLSQTAPLPLVSEVEPPPVEPTAERSPRGVSRGNTAYSCVHQLIVHSGGVIVRATKRAPVAFHPFVLQSLDRLLLQSTTSSSAATHTSPLSDLHLAALYWLTRALPALPFCSQPLLRRIEADNQQLAALHPLTHSNQMQHTVAILRSHRRMLAHKKQQAVQRHTLYSTNLAGVEQTVTVRLMERIRIQEKEETALGGLRAKEAADSSEYLLISSAIAAHQRLGSMVSGGADAEPLSSTSPGVAPHHRQRSSMASFDGTSASMPGRPTSRNEPYTRIRSVITSLLQTHGARVKPSPPALSTRIRASTVAAGARSNGRSQSAATELYTSHPHLHHSHRHSTDFATSLSERPQAIPEAVDEDETSLPVAPVLSPRPSADTGMAGQLSDVQRCERILGYFHSDLRRIYRHAIDSDMATQHKALTAAAATSGALLAAASPALPPAKPPSEQYAMNGLQFLRFVRQYRLYSATLAPHAIDLLYATKLQSKQAVYEQVMRQSGSVDTLNYDDWLELLVLIAVHTYRDEADVSVRVWRLLHDVLFPDVVGKLSGDYRVELSTTLCYTVLDKHSLWLQSVYASYATHSFQSSSLYRLHDQHSLNVYSINTIDERCMDETDWQHFIADSSLLVEHILADAGVRCVWANVQTDLTSEDYFGGERCMVYSEFTEALCVLGHYFERSPYVSVESKLDGLLAWLQSVPAMEERRHKHAVWAPGQQAPGLSITQQVPANISALPLT